VKYSRLCGHAGEHLRELHVHPVLRHVVEGQALHAVRAGGVGGGRTRLTPKGEKLLAQYRRFRTAVEANVGKEFAEAFGREP